MDLVHQLSQSGGNNVLLIERAKENAVSLFKCDSYVAITDATFEIYNSKKVAMKASYKWLQLKHLSISTDSIDMKFAKKQFTVQSPSSAKIFGAICHVLQQLLTHKELKTLDFPKYGLPELQRSGASALIRLKQLSEMNKYAIQQNIWSEIENTIVYSKTHFSLPESPECFGFLPYFFDIFPLIQNIESLSIPNYANANVYKVLRDYASCISKLDFIHIAGQAGPDFQAFMQKLQAKKQLKLSGIAFSDAQFSESDFDHLSAFVNSRKLQSIGFHSICFPADPIVSLSKLQSNFTFLSLDRTTSFKVRDIVRTFPSIQVLSLEGCSIEVSDALAEIQLLTNLRSINLSHNSCAKVPSSSIRFPAPLMSLVLNDIQWADDCLSGLLQTIFSQFRTGLKLSLSRAAVADKEWTTVLRLLEGTEFKLLLSLTWDQNPIYPSLFAFLQRNPLLESVSMNGCLHVSAPYNISEVARMIPSLRSIKCLLLRGTANSYIGHLIGAIISACRKTPSIKHLDISDNRIDVPGLQQVQKLFDSKSTLEVIACDGSHPSSAQGFAEFMDVAAQSQKRIRLSFPIEDVAFLKGSNQITEQFAKDLRKKFMISTNFQIIPGPYPPPRESPFLEPFNVFYSDYSEEFPQYLSSEDIKNLKAIQERNEERANTLRSEKPKPIKAATLFGQTKEEHKGFSTLELPKEGKVRAAKMFASPEIQNSTKTNQQPTNVVIKDVQKAGNISKENQTARKPIKVLPRPPAKKVQTFISIKAPPRRLLDDSYSYSEYYSDEYYSDGYSDSPSPVKKSAQPDQDKRIVMAKRAVAQNGGNRQKSRAESSKSGSEQIIEKRRVAKRAKEP